MKRWIRRLLFRIGIYSPEVISRWRKYRFWLLNKCLYRTMELYSKEMVDNIYSESPLLKIMKERRG